MKNAERWNRSKLPLNCIPLFLVIFWSQIGFYLAPIVKSLNSNVFILPFLGSVTEKNDAVEAAPSLINTSPMEDGWLFKVKLSDMEEVKELMDEEAYKKYLTEHEE